MRMSRYQASWQASRRVALLDPLRADSYFSEVFHSLQMPDAVYDSFSGYVPDRERIAFFDREQAMAATRDLGLVASTIVRWGGQVATYEPLESALLLLSQKTGEIPADTVESYGPRNQAGARTRTYTGTVGERFFIHSFTAAMKELPDVCDLLELARETPLSSPQYAQSLIRAYEGFQAMVQAIVGVHALITPEFFTTILRPYFEPKVVGGKSYYAPGGAQMALTLVDLLVWGAEDDTPEYRHYWRENVEYLPQSVRDNLGTVVRGGSLLRSAERAMAKECPNAHTQRSLEALRRFIVGLEQFRYPHRKVAEANMAIRSPQAVGSGGYTSSILNLLLELTYVARVRVSSLLS
ncbi:MAG TPA: monodechloroaminopyrrolnitrin synthase PrnB family protein [Patescibacteria group bacterium]